MTRTSDLERRIDELEGESTGDGSKYGERPFELTKEQKERLNEAFDVEPFADNDPCPFEEALWE